MPLEYRHPFRKCLACGLSTTACHPHSCTMRASCHIWQPYVCVSCLAIKLPASCLMRLLAGPCSNACRFIGVPPVRPSLFAFASMAMLVERKAHGHLSILCVVGRGGGRPYKSMHQAHCCGNALFATARHATSSCTSTGCTGALGMRNIAAKAGASLS